MEYWNSVISSFVMAVTVCRRNSGANWKLVNHIWSSWSWNRSSSETCGRGCAWEHIWEEENVYLETRCEELEQHRRKSSFWPPSACHKRKGTASKDKTPWKGTRIVLWWKPPNGLKERKGRRMMDYIFTKIVQSFTVFETRYKWWIHEDMTLILSLADSRWH